jgi:pimeloyl-ACP methyl ester carboxylesterase
MLHYETAGSGPPMLLLAGLASDHLSWQPVREALATRFTLIMPDNRGSGQTVLREGAAAVTIPDMAADAAALIDHMGMHDVTLLGHSMGTAIACEVAALRPGHVRQLILAAGAWPAGPRQRHVVETLDGMQQRSGMDALWYRALFGWLFAPAFFADPRAVDIAVAVSLAYANAPTPAMFSAQVAAIRGYTGPGRKLDAPVHVIAGAEDILIPPTDCAAFSDRLGAVSFHSLANAGHSLFWDQPDQAAALVLHLAA